MHGMLYKNDKYEGFLQVQNSFVPDEDLHGRNVVLLQSTVLCEMLDITADIWSWSHEPLSLIIRICVDYTIE